MAEIFKVEIITPDRIFYEGEAEFLEFTTTAGDIGVYAKHIPMTTVLAPGAVIIHSGDDEIAEIAEWPEEIDVSRAEAAKARAEEHIANKTMETDIKRAEFALRRALTRIDVANK